MTDFDALTYPDCDALIRAANRPWQRDNRAFYEGDHLQRGAGWVGPGPALGDAGSNEFLQVLEPAFIFKNAIKKGTDTKVNALLGRTPAWGMALARDTENAPVTEGEGKAIAETDAMLTAWWDERHIHHRLQDFGLDLELKGRANFRVFIPDSERDADGNLPALPLADSVKRVHLDVPTSECALIYEDRMSRRRIGLFAFRVEDEAWNIFTRYGALQMVGRNYIELTYLQDDGQTVLRTITEGAPESTALVMDLGGLLWHFQAEDEPLITAAIRSQQKKLNFAETTGRRNLADNGWLEEFLINAQLPGKFEPDPEQPGKKKFTPDPIRRGPGVSRQLASQTYTTEQEDGSLKEQVFPADVKWRPPVDPQGSMDVGQRAEWNIADELSQLHTLEGGGDNSSGEALKQRRASFGVSLLKSQTHLNDAGRWLLEITLAVGAQFSSDAMPEGLRVTFGCRIDTGPRTTLERTEDREQVAAGLMSIEEALNRDGIDDVDAELNRIASQPGAQVELQLKQAQLYSQLVQDLDAEQARRIAFGGEDPRDVLSEKKLIPAST